MKLSKNFTLAEFLVSQTASRNGIDMTPPPAVIDNIQLLVDTCMQPLRDDLGVVIYISSGYRPRILNRLIGGSTTSAHIEGRAADFRVVGVSPLIVCQRIDELQLPYDQNIHEFGRWTHLGIARQARRENLTAYHHNGLTRYRHGLIDVEEIAA